MAIRDRLAEFFAPASTRSLNGNGHESPAAVAPDGPTAGSGLAAKSVPIIDPRLFASFAQFVPIDSRGGTARLNLDALSWYAASWLAYVCMHYRATKLIEPPLWIKEEKDDQEEWISGDHALAELLERPNPDMEMADLLELTSLYLDSTGAAIWVKNRDRAGRVGSLYPFAGTDFRVESAGGRLFGKFSIRAKGGEKDLDPDDVIFFRNASPADPHGSVAPLQAALSRLGLDRQLVDSISNGLRNAIVPSVFLEFPPEMPLNPEQLEELQAKMEATFAEAKNHGRAFASNARARQGVMGFDGLNGGELGKEIEAAVCACFQVPPVVIGAFVGLANSSDRHNLETSVLLVYDNVILPTWARFEKALTRGLLREVDPNPLRFIRFDTSKVKALQDDLTVPAEVINKAGAALKIDDARTMLGLEKIGGETGERLLSEAPAMAPADDQPPAPPKSHRPRQQKADEATWLLFDSVTRAAELGWQLAADAQLDADRTAILLLAEKTLRTAQKDDDPFGPADPNSVRELIRQATEYLKKESRAQWRARVRPLVTSSASQAVQRVAIQLGLGFDLLQPGLLEYTEREAAWLVTKISETTRDEVRAALISGLEAGEGVATMRKRLTDLGTFGRSRAELIARTETTRVTNGSQLESLQSYAADTGEMLIKRWLATPDNRTREAHWEMNGEERPIDEAFSNGLQAPGEPNCRCTLTYSLGEAA